LPWNPKEVISGPYTRADTRSKDPLTRLRALELEGGIQDASIPLVANTMMLASPTGVPVASGLSRVKGIMEIIDAFKQNSMQQGLSGAAKLMSPQTAQWHHYLKGKLGL